MRGGAGRWGGGAVAVSCNGIRIVTGSHNPLRVIVKHIFVNFHVVGSAVTSVGSLNVSGL